MAPKRFEWTALTEVETLPKTQAEFIGGTESKLVGSMTSEGALVYTDNIELPVIGLIGKMCSRHRGKHNGRANRVWQASVSTS